MRNAKISNSHSWATPTLPTPTPTPFIRGGGGKDLPKIASLERGGVGEGVQNFLLETGNKLEKAGLPLFLLLYSSIAFTLYVGKVKFPLLLFFLRSFELAMQDFHPSLYSTKTLYHWYISDPFWCCTENVDSFI